MSRAYRIKVRESLTRHIRAEDSIQTQIEILEVLPGEQMAELLARELEGRGFQRRDDGTLVRAGDGVVITIDPCTGEVAVAAETTQTVELEGTREGYGYDDVGPNRSAVRERLSKDVQKELEKRAEQHAGKLQQDATHKLEKQLAALETELTRVVNRVTAEALKQKAAQIGEIKEVQGNADDGTLTIKVEV